MDNNNNCGVLFKSDKKTDKHPDYSGSAKVNGQDYYISVWVNTSKDGTKKYMSMKFNDANENRSVSTPAPAVHQTTTPVPAPVERTAADDDLPF